MKKHVIKIIFVLLLVLSIGVQQNIASSISPDLSPKDTTIGIVRINSIGLNSLMDLFSETNEYSITVPSSITPIHINYTIEGYSTTPNGMSYQGEAFFVIDGRIYENMGTSEHAIFCLKDGTHIITLAYLLSNGNSPEIMQDTIVLHLNSVSSAAVSNPVEFNLYDNYSLSNIGEIQDYEVSYPPTDISWVDNDTASITLVLDTSSDYSYYDLYANFTATSALPGIILIYDASGIRVFDASNPVMSVSRINNSPFGIISVGQLGSFINESSYSGCYSYNMYPELPNLGITIFKTASYVVSDPTPVIATTSSTTTSDSSSTSTSTSTSTTTSTTNDTSLPTFEPPLPFNSALGFFGLSLFAVLYRRKRS